MSNFLLFKTGHDLTSSSSELRDEDSVGCTNFKIRGDSNACAERCSSSHLVFADPSACGRYFLAAQTTPSQPQSVLTAPRGVAAENGTPNLTWQSPDTNAFAIVSPKFDQLISGSTATVSLKIGRQIERKTLRVVLNGKDITSRFSRGRDSAVLTSAQLRTGNNHQVAGGRGAHKEWKVKRLKFDYHAGESGETIAYYPSTTVGLSPNPGGAQPRVTLTAGTPASLQNTLTEPSMHSPTPTPHFPPQKTPRVPRGIRSCF